MPVSVNAALRESLSDPGHQHHHHHPHQLLQSQIASATKHLVLKTIEYEEYPENFLSQNDALKSKYILLSANHPEKGANGNSLVAKKLSNGSTSLNGSNGLDSSVSSSTNGSPVTPPTPKKDNKNELPMPKRILFPRDKIKVGWKGSERKWQVGSGFLNVGNTCYLNSTLQALLHVPAMANWLDSDTEHREQYSGGGDMCCTICAVANTLRMSQSAGHAVKPYPVYSRLRSICKHMVVGRQEDAHEFLRYLIEAMEKAYLERFPKSVLTNLDQYSKETTPLNQILGFYLRSSVRCLSCNHVSMTFQHFEDLLLDIRKSNTVDEALQGYFAREKLEDMDYTCSGCKKKVTATKQFSLERPPVVLCIQLKRFSMQGNKLNKQVSIKPKLDLTPYVRRTASHGANANQPLTYRLVSMVTHLGSSQHCGHYTAIGLTESGAYYQFDDSSVYPIALQNVLQTNAYIMFYELENAALHRTLVNGTGSAAAPSTITSPAITKVTNGMAKQLNGFASANAVPVTVNGNGVAAHKNFIGPVLPPNHPSVNNKVNGHAVSPAKKDSPAQNGHGLANGKAVNGNGKPTEAAGSAMVKKYPSAALLFKSPVKQGDTVTNGRESLSPVKRETPATVAQISPTSLVPYNSHLSSDEADTDDDSGMANGSATGKRERELPSSQNGKESPDKAKNGNGNFVPYVNSNSGVWKVCSNNGSSANTGTENGTPAKKGAAAKGSWKVLNELLSQDHNAYGGVAVSTWSGEKSNLDKETSAEKSLKRSSDRKADDDEMDRGHVKKIKLANKMGSDNPGYNAFQELENKNNQQQQANGFRPHSMNRHQSHHQTHKMGNGQSRSWVNNDRPSGMGGSYNKHKYHQNSNKNRPQKQWGRHNNFKKHGGNNRFKGNFSRGNHYHNGGRPNN